MLPIKVPAAGWRNPPGKFVSRARPLATTWLARGPSVHTDGLLVWVADRDGGYPDGGYPISSATSVEARMSRVGDLLHGGPVDAQEVARVRDLLVFEPPDLQKRLIRFGGLLVLASAIATYGLIGDSVATVIGAMIVAPLMLPIMGLAFSISIGDRKAIVSSILVGVGGMATSILVGFVLSQVMSSAFDPTSSSQIMSRTSPRLVDLAAALATGLAGAFATGRKDISDTLPGVAIAISLVPPLANVGILLAYGETHLALGSLLLFMTNYFAILLTGAFIFALLGFPRASLISAPLRSRRTAIVIVVVMIIVIAVPLGINSAQIYQDNVAEGRASQATKAWIENSDYDYVSVTAKDELVTIVVVGQGALPPEEQLRSDLAGRLYGMEVRVEALPSQSFQFESG
jgi:uncharacterized hydrophobic protein (TIGR00271 family)